MAPIQAPIGAVLLLALAGPPCIADAVTLPIGLHIHSGTRGTLD